MTKYEQYLQRNMMEYGLRFDATALDERFIVYFNTGQRIKVDALGIIATGTIGVTTGWKPCFLLMRTSRSSRSIYALSAADTIVAVKHGHKYYPVGDPRL